MGIEGMESKDKSGSGRVSQKEWEIKVGKYFIRKIVMVKGDEEKGHLPVIHFYQFFTFQNHCFMLNPEELLYYYIMYSFYHGFLLLLSTSSIHFKDTLSLLELELDPKR